MDHPHAMNLEIKRRVIGSPHERGAIEFVVRDHDHPSRDIIPDVFSTPLPEWAPRFHGVSDALWASVRQPWFG